MALPTCNCIKGLPQADKLDAIYCALLAIAEAGGTVDINDVTGMTPAGLGLITTLPSGAGDPAVVLISPTNVATVIQGLNSGVVSPVTSAQSVSGIIIALT